MVTKVQSHKEGRRVTTRASQMKRMADVRWSEEWNIAAVFPIVIASPRPDLVLLRYELRDENLIDKCEECV